jgi:hypothetical protein
MCTLWQEGFNPGRGWGITLQKDQLSSDEKIPVVGMFTVGTPL